MESVFENTEWIVGTPTGMGPIAEMTTDSAKLFFSFFARYSGIAFLSVTAVFFAPIIHGLLNILQVETDEGDAKK